jgi:hypothetical protein
MSPMKSASAPIGSCSTSGVAPRRLDDGVDAEEEVGARAVELVHEADAGDAVLVGLPPHGLDWGSTPATPSNTATAPSSTRSERSTSTVKSTWPGVSMMLIWCPSTHRWWPPR